MITILFIFLLTKLFSCVLEYLNYKHLKRYGSNVPNDFEKIINAEQLKKTTNYTIEKFKLEIVDILFNTGCITLFIFGGILNLYNSWLLKLNYSYHVTFILFFICLFLGYAILDIPFDLYKTFYIERRYGFNTVTPKLWIFDTLKSFVISTILISILCFTFSYVLIHFPHYWWLIIWIFFFLFTIFMLYISPYILEPLFNKFTPVDNEDLTNPIKAVLEKVGIKVNKVLKMDASKRTKHTNAYFSGIGHVKRIILFDTLLEKMINEEILSVVAHEAGHWKKKHIWKHICLFEIIALIFFFVAFKLLATNMLLSGFKITVLNVVNLANLYPIKLFLLYFLAGIIMFSLTPIFNFISRKHEKEADIFAVNLVGTPVYLVSALIKLSSDNLSNLYPHPLYEIFHYSHPSILKRIKQLKKMQ